MGLWRDAGTSSELADMYEYWILCVDYIGNNWKCMLFGEHDY